MQTAVLVEPGVFELRDRTRPEPGPDDVLVAIRNVGICGSDIHYYEHGRIGDYVVESPIILGHESAGEVIDVGSAVTGLSPGDRVALEPGVPCRRCRHCKHGRYNLCESVEFMATPPHDGAFAEYVSWPADYCYRLPESVSTLEGALCEPLSVGIHAIRRGDVTPGDTVLVTGAGPIGLLVAAAARAAGATDVLITDVVSKKLEFARQRGVDRTINVAETDLTAAVDAYTDGTGADIVVECSGAEPSIKSTLDVVRRGGTVVLVGLSDEAEVPINVLDVIDNELDVHGSFRYHNSYMTAIDLLADDIVDVEGIVDFESPLSEVDTAFDRATGANVVKGMISLDGRD
jgi:L-iditol 2-dehydrogenase